MNEEELRGRLAETAVVRSRFGSPGALIRGWRLDSAQALSESAAAQAAGRILRNMTMHLDADSVTGIERAGTVLSRSIAAEATKDGVPLSHAGLADSREQPLSGHGPGRRTVLIDDIVNSGRTMRRAIKALESSGVEVLAAACLVRYPKRHPLWLRGWDGPLLSAFDLCDLHLQRFFLGLHGFAWFVSLTHEKGRSISIPPQQR